MVSMGKLGLSDESISDWILWSQVARVDLQEVPVEASERIRDIGWILVSSSELDENGLDELTESRLTTDRMAV